MSFNENKIEPAVETIIQEMFEANTNLTLYNYLNRICSLLAQEGASQEEILKLEKLATDAKNIVKQKAQHKERLSYGDFLNYAQYVVRTRNTLTTHQNLL